MLTPNTDTTTTVRHVGGNLFMLVMDAQGKPLALAPLEKLGHSPFPAERIRVIDGEAQAALSVTGPSLTDKTDAADSLVPLVESALKRLYDLGFLAEHPLGRLNLVTARLTTSNAPTHSIARGRVVRALLQEAIEQLRPDGPVPARTSLPRREWHPYLILYSAYVEEEQNYDIMNWLQLSEGTFNRTRRRALQTAAQVMGEMELQVQ